MNSEEFLKKLRDSDPHTRYMALKAMGPVAEAISDARCLKVVVRICNRDKLAYNRLEAMNVLRGAWSEPGVIDAFAARLEDDGYIAEACIRILGEIADPSARSLLAKTFLETNQMHIKLQVIHAFQGADQTQIFEFLKTTDAHDSKDDRIRASVVSLLAEVKNPTLRSVFMKALQDTNARVRANAVEALSDICQGKELMQILAHCLKDRNNRVRANALRGLIRLGVGQAVPLVHEMAHHQNPLYRSSAAWILGEVGDKIQNGKAWLAQLAKDNDHNVTYRADLAAQQLQQARAA